MSIRETAAGIIVSRPSVSGTSLDGSLSLLVPGSGWTPVQSSTNSPSAPPYYLYANAPIATLLFPEPLSQTFELRMSCTTLQSTPASAITGILLRENGEPLQFRGLGPEWRSLTFTLSRRGDPGTLREVSLEFFPAFLQNDLADLSAESSMFAACGSFSLYSDIVPSTPMTHSVVTQATRQPLAEWSIVVPADAETHFYLETSAFPPSSRTQFVYSRPTIQIRDVTWHPAEGTLALSANNSSPVPAEMRVLVVEDASTASCHSCSNAALAGQLASRAPVVSRQLPNIFVYLVDTLRADSALGFGEYKNITPSIHSFRHDAVTFSNAWAPSSWTLPSVVSFMTGLHPTNHGVVRLNQRLAEDIGTTLAQYLHTNGYQTVAITQSRIIGPRYGLDRGFEKVFVLDQLGGSEHRSQDLRSLFRTWATSSWDDSRPVFAYLHTVEPHGPYSPDQYSLALLPISFQPHLLGPPLQVSTLTRLGDSLSQDDIAYARALYDSEVAIADREFGHFLSLLKAMGIYDASLIVFLSDHGEEFNEESGFGHGRHLHEVLTRIPLVIKMPFGRWRKRVVDQPVSLTDLPAFLISILPLESAPSAFPDSVSFSPLLEGGPLRRRVAVAEVVDFKAPHSSLPILHRSLVLDGIRCIHSQVVATDRAPRQIERWKYYRTGALPSREVALDPRVEGAAVCRQALSRYHARTTSFPGLSAPLDLTTEEVRSLQALGYLD
ncbi:MAG: sulfatase [candidate division WOR-3 bacterium]